MINFISIDSSLANTGIAVGTIEADGSITITDIDLHETKPDKSKKIRASSDAIARCKSTYGKVKTFINTHKPKIIFVETPSGSQNSSAMKSYGATCMLIASLSPNPIQVTPNEVKEGSVGVKTASKADMIHWAHSLYPNLNWDKNKDGSLKNKNEHMADAIAIVHAGVQTDDFQRIKNFLENVIKS